MRHRCAFHSPFAHSQCFDKGVLAEILEDIMGKGLIPADPLQTPPPQKFHTFYLLGGGRMCHTPTLPAHMGGQTSSMACSTACGYKTHTVSKGQGGRGRRERESE